MSALSDQLVTFAILAYLVAMISHAVEYAVGNARKVPTAAPARELVGAGVGGPGGTIEEPATPAPTRPDRSAARAALAGRIAAWITVLAAALHLGAVVTRGIAAERMPWGNMYEFVLTVTWIGAAAWLAVLW
ncbi:c-type cytochrome biogenesis protein CcsB, partial [Micromonospora chersina]